MKYIFFLATFLLASFGSLQAQSEDLPEPMSPPCLVNDFAQIFTREQAQDLELTLRAYHDSTSTQIYIITVADLNGYSDVDYATRIGNKWGIGQKGKDNGVIILIKPRNEFGGGRVAIVPGYGLEEFLTDGRCGRIIDDDMIPYLKTEDYYTASINAVSTIIKYLSGQFQSEPTDDINFLYSLIIIFIAIYILYRISKRNGGSGGSYGGRPPTRGFFGGFPSGGGYSGRSSGGGFSGGGGGSFGGGGSSRGFW